MCLFDLSALKKPALPAIYSHSNYLNPEFAVAIYYGLQILAATLVYCLTPVLLTGAQRETIGTFVPHLFHPPDEIKTTRCTCSRLRHDFVPQHNYDYACVTPAECLEATPKGMQCDNKFKNRLALSDKTLQLRVSLRFASPRYDAYCKIWIKDAFDFILYFGQFMKKVDFLC
jgi:hypothetical protein